MWEPEQHPDVPEREEGTAVQRGLLLPAKRQRRPCLGSRSGTRPIRGRRPGIHVRVQLGAEASATANSDEAVVVHADTPSGRGPMANRAPYVHTQTHTDKAPDRDDQTHCSKVPDSDADSGRSPGPA